MPVKYELCVPNGTYTKDGQQKTSWLKIGRIMSKKDGSGFVMKLDSIPVSQIDQDGNSVAFNGWVNMFEAKPREAQGNGGSQQASGGTNNFEDDIPF